MHDEHEIETEAIDEGQTPYSWKVSCSCGWTRYCRTADETQEAVYEHRAALITGGGSGEGSDG